MAEISKREKQLDWACRILITVDIFVIVAGYFDFFQTQRQLVTPLIPRDTVYKILILTNNSIMKASLFSAGLFLAGLWLYSFKKKIPAIILFVLAALSFKLLPVLF